MNDIKIFVATKVQMQLLLKVIENLPRSTNMGFRIDKYRILTIERGKYQIRNKTETLNNEILYNMKSEGTYLFFMLVFYSNPRYLYVPSDFMLYSISLLSVSVLFRIVYIFCFCSVLFRIRKKYKQRLSQILRSELNFKNTFKAIKTYTMLVLTYLSGIIK